MKLTPTNKRDAYSRIKQFYLSADVTLTGDEENILTRWLHADAVMRSRKHTRDEMVNEMVEKFGVSKFTAQNDINQAQKLFEVTRQSSKKYLLSNHIENIGLAIQKLEDKLLDSNKNLNMETIEILHRYYAEYTKAITALPDDQLAEKQPLPKFVFMPAAGQTVEKPMAITDAMKKAGELLMKEKNGVFVYDEQ